ncbi:MAG: hypothetical protein K6A35_10610 [bacterium]|nr:hypothetical protein [bacterium]
MNRKELIERAKSHVRNGNYNGAYELLLGAGMINKVDSGVTNYHYSVDYYSRDGYVEAVYGIFPTGESTGLITWHRDGWGSWTKSRAEGVVCGPGKSILDELSKVLGDVVSYSLHETIRAEAIEQLKQKGQL